MEITDAKNKNLLFQYFDRLTRYPRYPEDLSSDAFLRLIRSMGYHPFQDKSYNVILQLPPSPGLEEAPRLILQGHLDMVCLKEEGLDHDFSIDPIRIVEEGGWLRAKGTSLGADNTMGLSMMLALLDDPIPLPQTRFIFTNGKVRGMHGAKNLESRFLDADILVNLDSKIEGIVGTSSSGGMIGSLEIPLKRSSFSKERAQVRIRVDGLRGGNAGDDILDVRSNAIKVLADFLWRIDQSSQILINSFYGNTYESVIPSFAQAIISFPVEESERVFEAMAGVRDALSDILLKSDPDFRFTWDQGTSLDPPMDHPSSQRLLNLIMMLPHGVFTMKAGTDQIESSDNLYSVITEKQSARIRISLRTSSLKKGKELEEKILQIVQTFSGTGTFEEGDPAWIRRERSPVRDLYFKVYSQMTGNQAGEGALHSANECGIFQRKNPELDLISIGPDMKDTQTLKERVSMDSSLRTYLLLRKLIREIAQTRRE